MINVHAAKTQLSAVAEIEKSGESVLICRNGRPVADLVPHRVSDRLRPHPVMRKIPDRLRSVGADGRRGMAGGAMILDTCALLWLAGEALGCRPRQGAGSRRHRFSRCPRSRGSRSQ